jgi:hypothetical protein
MAIPDNADVWSEKLSTITFSDKLNFGYSIGLEYNYQLSKQLNFVTELSYEQYKYTPRKATIEYENERWSPYEWQKKVKVYYVDKIADEWTSSQNRPENKRLKEPILFDNIYLGIGLKYNLWRK